MPSSSGRDDHPCRATRAARSNRRGSWFGHGQIATTEKSGFGRFLDDLVYAFADVSVPLIPALFFVSVATPNRFFGLKTSALVAWTTMVLVAALIRGGWLPPLATETRGWVSLAPALLLFRVAYFNALLAVATYGGGTVATTLALPLVSIGVSVVAAGIGIATFPRLAELFCDRFLVSGVRPSD
ncbi:hypothetical protein [Haladaptatus sp. DYF46]|uniref:hypothetical protein n=1 Tax=Haladaptatus sp. DYF46 TaxID=2886041 RepID=UPI001E381AF8|nr:hypothetical protein [Haladaptatus sp. DYF46]